ncbi:GNAT family N-acetyltransferase [Arthrobacter sp. AET 35A]|uniref:GNAT family N-acetyltransferase n=1 Tax=Arthrobacter sp. AET 35A TaxID=2292643 RepID=UPI00177D6D18|nr:GNAT family N-acetyltransferase [Arthrobacter sp. AET 35A]MBE0011425.1 GNAT family N-acetyltransferase [Arthrobacter sp. AET 35A]
MTASQDPAAPAPLRIDTFTVTAETDCTADSPLAHWFEAIRFGFHETRTEPEDLPTYAGAFASDGRTLWGAYDDAAGTHAWDPRIPVATYGTMVNSLNVGNGQLIDAHLITAVTVRPTHRRRGLLRRMMTADLDGAAAKGFAVAALTASEATIYGRFGFGTATFTRNIEVDVKERFALRPPAYGATEVVSPASAAALSEQIFGRFHHVTTGSLGRQFSYPQRASGRWGEERPVEDKGVRTAVHYDDDGRPDGYVSSKFSGWGTSPYTMKIIDLVAASGAAYLELWRYLGSIDLIERITFNLAPVNDPLPWALEDRRCYKLTGDEDVLWLRILDPVKALAARGYQGAGTVTLEIVDPLGYAAGRYRLSAADGTGALTRLDDDADTQLRVAVAALGSLYLGGVPAHTLAAVGHIAEQGPDGEGSIDVLDRIFQTPSDPYCITHF